MASNPTPSGSGSGSGSEGSRPVGGGVVSEVSEVSGVRRREIFGWALYDVADSAFTTVIITTFYSLYFRDIVVGDEGRATMYWGRANAVTAVIVAALAPVLGAIADYAGCRKRFLAGFAALLFVFTALLGTTGPGTLWPALVFFVLANVGFAGGGVFIDSFLPGLSTESNAGRISGLKWAMGYAGGLSVVLLCLGLSRNIRPGATAEEVALARWIPVVVAGWYAVMVIPVFVLLRERGVARRLPPGENYLTVGFRQLGRTFGHLRRYRDLAILFAAFVAYNEGISTVIQFASLFAKDTVGFTPPEIGRMFILMNVIALVGALSFGWLADRIGQKRAIFLSLAIWVGSTTVAYFSHSKSMFYVSAALAGIGMGSCQSVTRSLVALFSPKENAAEFYGFLGIAGKALAFVGPLVFGEISAAAGSQRPAILSLAFFFVVGAVILSFVDERRGIEASKVPVDAES
jgi:UMF1 family MFS transporter